MRINLVFDSEFDPGLYSRYSSYIYRQVLKEVQELSSRKRMNYKIRESYLLGLIPWTHKPETIDLIDYINHSLRLHKVNSTYVIDLDESRRVKGSNMKVSQLVRLLEYGTIELKELPVIRRVLDKYSRIYQNLAKDYVMEVLLK